MYFDERGVARQLEASLQDHVWKMWCDTQGFSQRFTGTIADNGDTIIGQRELSRDNSTWQNDL